MHFPCKCNSQGVLFGKFNQDLGCDLCNIISLALSTGSSANWPGSS